MGGIRPWTLLVSVAVHLAVLLLVLDRTDDQGAAAVGLGGLEVALGPAGGATTSPVAPDAPPVEEVRPPPAEAVDVAEEIPPELPAEPETVEPVALEPVPPEPPPEPPQDLPVEVQAAEATQSPLAEPPPSAEPDTPPLLTSSAVDPVETVAAVAQEVRAEPVPTARPVETETVEAREPPAVKPPPPPKPRREPQRQAPARVAAPPTPTPQTVAEAAPAAPAPAAAAPAADPGPPAPTRGTPGAAQGSDVDSDAGGGLPGPTPDYLGLLRAWLEKHKEYPRPSRNRREEGTVLLRFVMERSGRVVSHRIERSSGHPALDRAVEEMLARAQPLPAMPPEMLQAKLELVVPVQFALRER